MRKLSRLPAIICGAVAFVVCVLFFTLLFLPAREIRGAAARCLEAQGYTLSTASFGKAFPLGLKAKGLEVADGRGTLVKLDEARVTLDLLPLFIGKVRISITGRVGDGEIATTIAPLGKGEVTLRLDRVPLEKVPFFKTAAGMSLKGRLDASGSFRGLQRNPDGELKLEVRSADVADVVVGSLPLPAGHYDRVQGMFRVAAGRGRLESFSMQGGGIYARLSGTATVGGRVAAAPLELSLELMPKPEFMERQKLVFLLLARYAVSPGNYRIPIGGTLGSPALR